MKDDAYQLELSYVHHEENWIGRVAVMRGDTDELWSQFEGLPRHTYPDGVGSTFIVDYVAPGNDIRATLEVSPSTVTELTGLSADEATEVARKQAEGAQALVRELAEKQQ